MKLLIVGKSAFSRVIDGTRVPISIAGHTVQLIRPLTAYALARGFSVSYAYPLTASASDCLMFDPDDEVPSGLVEVPFTDPEAPKSPLHVGWLAVEAAIRQAAGRLGGLDWVVLASTFPLAPFLADLRWKYGYKLALLIRGGDGYQWLDPDWAARTFGDIDRAREVCRIYGDSLRSADFVGVASRWLGSVIEERGIRWDAVVESPAAAWAGPSPEPRWDKSRFAADTGVVRRLGYLDPTKKWLVSAGRFHPDKRLDLTSGIFSGAALKGWQLIFSGVGATREEIEDDLMLALVDKGAACVIEVPPRIVYALFKVCDACLHTALPSATFIDARPSSVTSAAFHGKPVIAPLAPAGGVTESLSPENVQAYCFDVQDVDPADRAEVVRRGVDATLRLQDTDVLLRVGAANARHASSSAAASVFDDLLARLSRLPARGKPG